MKNNTNNKNILQNKSGFSLFYEKFTNYLPNHSKPSVNFLNWFIGFTEGDGSFIVNNRGDLAFIVIQSTSDIKLLYFILETLGFGKVISQSVKTSRYVTQSKLEIDIIISLFNGNIILPTRRKNLELFIKGFNSWQCKGKIRLKSVEFMDNFVNVTLDNSWLAGFTDAEGCFSCSIKKKSYSINYSIAQKGYSNIIILNQIRSLFNSGKVNNHSVKDVYEYRINGTKQCSVVFDYFDKYNLLSKKNLSYILWKKMHKDLLEKFHLDLCKKPELVEKASIINKSNVI